MTLAGPRVVSFAAISCVHCPHQNVDAWAKVVEHLARYKPHVVVLLGDLFESDAASVHPRDTICDVTHEFEEAGKCLRSLRLACSGETRYVWMLGNHDDNLQVADPRRIPKALRKAVHWNRDPDWGDEFRRWEQYPYIKGTEGCFELGPVIFYHGFDIATNSDRNEGIQMVNACGGHSHRLTVRGHTHRPVPVTQSLLTSKITLPHWYANVGTLGPLKPAYMARKDTAGWGPAMLVGETLVGAPLGQPGGWGAELIHL